MMHQESLVLPLSDIRAGDLPLVGGKGANLGGLTHAGFPVPPGFCLATVAFQQFLDACATSENLHALLDTVGPNGEAALLDAVRRCWVSLFADRAIVYRVRNGFAHQVVQVSVVDQQMVMSEVSGTLATRHPPRFASVFPPADVETYPVADLSRR